MGLLSAKKNRPAGECVGGKVSCSVGESELACEIKRPNRTMGHVKLPWSSLLLCLAIGVSLVVFPLIYPLGRINPPHLLLFVVLCGVCGLYAPLKKCLVGLFGLTALLLAVLLFTPMLNRVEDKLLMPAVPPQSADVIVVLAGSAYCGSQQLDTTSLARLSTGVELWQAGYAQRMTLSAPVPKASVCPTIAKLQEEQLGRWFPASTPELFTIVPPISGTHYEAVEVASLARQQGWKRLLLVTTPTHLRRATATFRQQGLTVIPVASAQPDYEGALWDVGSRFQALPAITRELVGWVKYRVHGWI
jgi:uncharacterized SAM-binding protein YcdF (DUF218 family)